MALGFMEVEVRRRTCCLDDRLCGEVDNMRQTPKQVYFDELCGCGSSSYAYLMRR